MWYRYDLAGLCVLCHIPYDLIIQEESRPFLRPLAEGAERPDPDLTVDLIPVESLPERPENGHWEVCQYHVKTDQESFIYHCPCRGCEPYACVVWNRTDSGLLRCYYRRGEESQICYSHNIRDLIGLENLLWHHHGLLMHASFIRWQGRGILFCAPSGTGKSTQADLWARCEGADILNGDRAALRRDEAGWTAYGLPYAGSSGIYRREQAPVCAVIALRQAGENRLRPLRAAEAVRCLFAEVAVHRWDREYTERAVTMLLELVTEVPVYLLECRPDEEAVRLVREAVSGQFEEGV